MATLPRTSKLSRKSQAPPVSFTPPGRPTSAVSFDAGLNSSAAWNEHQHQQSGSLSDEEAEPEDDQEKDTPPGRMAQVLYQFTGKPEFREIVKAEPGQEVEVLKEDVGEGWSLVKLEGEMGLLPQSYYKVCHIRRPPNLITYVRSAVYT